MTNVAERGVKIQEVDENNSAQAMQGVGSDVVSWEPMEFEQVTFNNFHVEYAIVDGNFVVHFFVHPEAIQHYRESDLQNWWQKDFAIAMSNVAQEHFKATKPRIMAKYTMETASWWFKAQGYGHLLDPMAFLHEFFGRLDETVPPVLPRTSAPTTAKGA